MPAEHLPTLVILGKADPMVLHFWLSISFKELANGLHVHWFYCLNGFCILMINLFLIKSLNFSYGNNCPYQNETSIHFTREILLIIDEGIIF